MSMFERFRKPSVPTENPPRPHPAEEEEELLLDDSMRVEAPSKVNIEASPNDAEVIKEDLFAHQNKWSARMVDAGLSRDENVLTFAQGRNEAILLADKYAQAETSEEKAEIKQQLDAKMREFKGPLTDKLIGAIAAKEAASKAEEKELQGLGGKESVSTPEAPKSEVQGEQIQKEPAPAEALLQESSVASFSLEPKPAALNISEILSESADGKVGTIANRLSEYSEQWSKYSADRNVFGSKKIAELRKAESEANIFAEKFAKANDQEKESLRMKLEQKLKDISSTLSQNVEEEAKKNEDRLRLIRTKEITQKEVKSDLSGAVSELESITAGEAGKDQLTITKDRFKETEDIYFTAYKSHLSKEKGAGKVGVKELDAFKMEYDAARAGYANALTNSARTRLMEKRSRLMDNENAKERPVEQDSKIIERYNKMVRFREVIKPATERKNQIRLEVMGEKEKGIFSKGTEWFVNGNKWLEEHTSKNGARAIRAISTTIIAGGIGVGTGAFAAMGTLALAGWGAKRVARVLGIGSISAAGGELAAQAYGRLGKVLQRTSERKLHEVGRSEQDIQNNELTAKDMERFDRKLEGYSRGADTKTLEKEKAVLRALLAFGLGGELAAQLAPLPSISSSVAEFTKTDHIPNFTPKVSAAEVAEHLKHPEIPNPVAHSGVVDHTPSAKVAPTYSPTNHVVNGANHSETTSSAHTNVQHSAEHPARHTTHHASHKEATSTNSAPHETNAAPAGTQASSTSEAGSAPANATTPEGTSSSPSTPETPPSSDDVFSTKGIKLPAGMDPNSPEATAWLNRAYNPQAFPHEATPSSVDTSTSAVQSPSGSSAIEHPGAAEPTSDTPSEAPETAPTHSSPASSENLSDSPEAAPAPSASHAPTYESSSNESTSSLHESTGESASSSAEATSGFDHVFTNKLGISIDPSKPHLYPMKDQKAFMIWGGNPDQQDALLNRFLADPKNASQIVWQQGTIPDAVTNRPNTYIANGAVSDDAVARTVNDANGRPIAPPDPNIFMKPIV